MCVSPSRPLADSEKLPVRTHRPEAVKSPGADEDGESIQQEPKKRSSKEKREKKKDKDKDRKVCLSELYREKAEGHAYVEKASLISVVLCVFKKNSSLIGQKACNFF